MKYQWSDYAKEHEALVDSWLDDEAVRQTGLDSGWDDFFEYWKNDSEMSLGENYWCKIISHQGTPFAVMALSVWKGEFLIMEYVVDPKMRGKGLGSSALRELLDFGDCIVSTGIEQASAVIFPANKSSQKAFEKAGFYFLSADPDGDAFNYSYKKRQDR